MNLPNAESLFETLAERIKLVIKANTAIVGIHSGGAWLTDRLLPILGKDLEHGILDVSFYRDDYAKRGLKEEVRPSQIPFEIEGANILLVDDVLYTGRTTRAAINTLFDYGRPAKIMLAALVDRGGRELPISADFVAKTLVLPTEQMLVLQKADDGRLSLTIDHA